MIKVLLVDDHKLVRDGLKVLLEKDNNIKVVCEAESGEEALEKIIKEKDLDLAIVDILLPGMSGIELTKHLTKLDSGLAILILSMYNDEEYIKDALNAGAKQCLSKGATSEELHNTIAYIFSDKSCSQIKLQTNID